MLLPATGMGLAALPLLQSKFLVINELSLRPPE